MKSKFWSLPGLLTLLGFATAAWFPAAAQKGAERTVNRTATAAGPELLLYAQPKADSRTTKLSNAKSIHVFSEVDSVWYRVLYAGSEFFARRADLTLAPPAPPAKGKAAPVRRR